MGVPQRLPQERKLVTRHTIQRRAPADIAGGRQSCQPAPRGQTTGKAGAFGARSEQRARSSGHA